MLFPSGRSINLVPPTTALARTYDATVSASTQVTFNANTQLVEVSAIDKSIFMKWGSTAVTSSNFDECILGGTTRQYFLPLGVSAATFIEESATAKLVVIEK